MLSGELGIERVEAEEIRDRPTGQRVRSKWSHIAASQELTQGQATSGQDSK